MVMSNPEMERKGAHIIKRAAVEKPVEIHIIGNFAYETNLVTGKNERALRIRARPFEEFVGYDSIEASDQIRHNIQRSKKGKQVEVVFVRAFDPKAKKVGKDIGVVTQTIVDIPTEQGNKRFLDIGVKAIEKKDRDKGIGFRLLLNEVLGHKEITDVTGQSRNGRVFSYLEKLKSMGFTETVIGGYDQDLTPMDLEELKSVISKKKFRQVSKLGTGLCPNIYSPADPALFEASEGNQKAKDVVDKLKKRGVAPGGRHGIRYRMRIIQEAVARAREDYMRTETYESVVARSRYEELLEKVRRLGSFVKFPPMRRNIIPLFSK